MKTILLLIGVVALHYATAEQDIPFELVCSVKYLKDSDNFNDAYETNVNLDNVNCDEIIEKVQAGFYARMTKQHFEEWNFSEADNKCVVDFYKLNRLGDSVIKLNVYEELKLSEEKFTSLNKKFIRSIFLGMESCNGTLAKYFNFLFDRLTSIIPEQLDPKTDFCQRKSVIDSKLTTPETSEIINSIPFQNSDNIVFDCTEAITGSKAVQDRFVSNVFITIDEAQLKCLNRKMDQADLFAKTLAIKVMNRLEISKDQIDMEKMRFAESLVQFKLTECH